MKEFEKQAWLEELADKFELLPQQVMLAYAVYDEAMDMFGHHTIPEHFEEVLSMVFKD